MRFLRSSKPSKAVIERRCLEVGGVAVEVLRKNIKHLHLGVYPPDGRVRVSAPRHFDDAAVHLAVVTRLDWIRRHRAALQRQSRQSQREFATGESHYFAGRRYRLDVIEGSGSPSVRLRNNRTMELRVRPGSSRSKREAVLHGWYRQQLRAQLPVLVAQWEPIVGVTVNEVRIKRMKTRWGSCNINAKRIWLNLELAKKPPSCLHYVLVHELVHLLERRHNRRFRALMDRFMPQWRLHRDELNRAPLPHESWRC